MKLLQILLIIFSFSINLFSQTIQSSDSTISILAVGDMMLGTDFPRNRLPKDNGKFLLSNVNPILKDADLTFGNLECVLLDGGKPDKICKDTNACYLFRSPTSFVDNFVDAGFDVLSIANNHINDFGDDGIASTIEQLKIKNIVYSGIVNEESVFKSKNINIDVLTFSTSPNNYSLLNIPYAQKLVKDSKEKNDIVVVTFHGGAEGEDAKNIPDSMEVYYEEERGEVKRFSKAVIDAGADLVIGHGPHVPRALNIYKNRLIAYSLGNFCTYKGFSISGSKGLAPILNVELDFTGKFIKGKIISTKQNREVGNYVDKNNKAAKLIKKLTEEDFPNTNITIDNNGNIRKK